MNQALVHTLESLQTNISSVIDIFCPYKQHVWTGSLRELVYCRAVEKGWVGWNVCKQRAPCKGIHWDRYTR